jgi:hypothetical protein
MTRDPFYDSSGWGDERRAGCWSMLAGVILFLLVLGVVVARSIT